MISAAQANQETDSEGEPREMSEELRGFLGEVELPVHYAKEAELFHTPDGKPYATFWVDDHYENWPVEGKRFEQYLRQRYYEDKGTAPKAYAINDAIATIAARATFGCPELPVFRRIADYGGAVYVDLANEAWEVVEVTPAGIG